jgi:hypothetical protein
MFKSAERGPGGTGEALDEGLDDGALTVTVFVTVAAGCEPPHADRAAAVTANAAIRVLTNITASSEYQKRFHDARQKNRHRDWHQRRVSSAS